MANGEQSYGEQPNEEVYMRDLVTKHLEGMVTSCKGKYDPKNIVHAKVSMNGDDTTFILHQIKCEGKKPDGKKFRCSCYPTYPTEKDMDNN